MNTDVSPRASDLQDLNALVADPGGLLRVSPSRLIHAARAITDGAQCSVLFCYALILAMQARRSVASPSLAPRLVRAETDLLVRAHALGDAAHWTPA